MKSSTYRYKISASLVINGKSTKILSESITSLVIDNKYDTNNMPIIYMSFNIQLSIYDKMVLNKDDGIIILRIQRANTSSSNPLYKDYIYGKFTYIMNTNLDYHRSLRESSDSYGVDDNKETEYKQDTIALFMIELMEQSKRIYNNIIKNSTMTSIVNKFTNNMNMVIEPFTNDTKIDCIVLPPIASVSSLLEYLDEYRSFYLNRSYRYYRDFNATYILNSKGNKVRANDKYNTVILNLLDSSDERVQSSGIVEDDSSKAYVMYVDAEKTSMTLDMTQHKEYNTVIGISSSGRIKRSKLKLSVDGADTVLLQRIYNDNDDRINGLQNEIDSIGVMLQVTRTEVDGSIFTLNKEYKINNYREYKRYNGNYMLSYKKEAIIPQGDEFISEIILGLRKVIE